MSTIVLQLTRTLNARPEVQVPHGIALRNFAGEDDIARWLDVRHRAFARQRMGVPSWTADDFRREFQTKSWWRPEHLWLADTLRAKCGSVETVGTVALAFRGSGSAARPVVHWLAVLPEWRRRGVARALMATLEQRCWDTGYRQIWLETLSAWQAAVELYRRLGYEPCQGRTEA
jgi:GNAT superfamily N-acetyltransferase